MSKGLVKHWKGFLMSAAELHPENLGSNLHPPGHGARAPTKWLWPWGGGTAERKKYAILLASQCSAFSIFFSESCDVAEINRQYCIGLRLNQVDQAQIVLDRKKGIGP